MIEAFDENPGNIVAAMEVPDDKASSYGILDIKDDMGSLVSTKGMVEKPAPGTQPSNLAVIGRYILMPSVLQKLNKKQIGAGGEIQLTDAIDEAREDGEEVYGFRFKGHRYDCGSKAGFLQATVAFALARDDLKDDLLKFIHEIVAADNATR
jgi:UTP--glucose-1-phosphate uridylyltransferase